MASPCKEGKLLINTTTSPITLAAIPIHIQLHLVRILMKEAGVTHVCIILICVNIIIDIPQKENQRKIHHH